MADIAVPHARPSPSRALAVPSPAVRRLGLLAHAAPVPRPCLALCWTTDRAGRPVAHWDAEPPD